MEMIQRERRIIGALTVCVWLASGCRDFDSCPSIAEIQPALSTLPDRLSETGLFASDGVTLASGVLAYTPAFELWSDGAEKRRFIALPEGGVIDVSDPDDWQFPRGTKLWKEFSRDGVRVETRLLLKFGDRASDWAMAPYVWSEDQRDADLTPQGARDARGTEHDVPAADRCPGCHGGRSGRVLGFSAVQLGNSGDGALVLAKLAERGALSGAVPDATVPGSNVERAALGYLHANCSHCHNSSRPASDGPRCYDPANDLDMFLSVGTLDDVRRTPTYRTVVGSKVAPGEPESSELLERVSTRSTGAEIGTDQMPPLATERVDAAGVELLRQWILALRR